MNDDIQKIYISDLDRTLQTSEKIFGDEDFNRTSLLNEVPLHSGFDIAIRLPLGVWNVLGRLQWLNGKRIGITTVGDRGYIAMYADSSTEEDPVVKVGKYEVHVKDVDPNHATRMEMFALLSYMDDQGLTDNHGMSSYSKMKAYASQAEYNGFASGIEDADLAWSKRRDWIAILRNAKETFLNIPETNRQVIDIDRIVFSLMKRR